VWNLENLGLLYLGLAGGEAVNQTYDNTVRKQFGPVYVHRLCPVTAIADTSIDEILVGLQ